MQETRKCRQCGVELVPGSTIQKSRSRECTCRECYAASGRPTRSYLATALWAKNNPVRYRAGVLLSGAKARAASSGQPFNLTIEDVVIPSHCPVLGIPLAHSPGKPAAGSPTLDRFDPNLGYVKGNVFVISSLANRIKNNATTEQIGKVHAWMREVERMRSQANSATPTTLLPD